MTPRPIYIQCCIEGPEYNSGPMPTLNIPFVPTMVLHDLEERIREELAARTRITMVLTEHLKEKK